MCEVRPGCYIQHISVRSAREFHRRRDQALENLGISDNHYTDLGEAGGGRRTEKIPDLEYHDLFDK